MSPSIRAFFDQSTNTVSYLVWDPATLMAAVIDPVLDYDIASGKATTVSSDKILRTAAREDLNIIWVLETHVHADHLSGAMYIKARTNARVGIGEHIAEVQNLFGGSSEDFDKLFADDATIELGSLVIEIIYGPGHTPADVSYKIADCVFVGDTLFMPDYGTARADFPGGDARQLYRSIRNLLALPPQTRLFMCHDYKAPGRDDYGWETTVGEQRRHNVHVHDGVSEDDFAARRNARDATLTPPKLFTLAIQANIRAGRLPALGFQGKCLAM